MNATIRMTLQFTVFTLGSFASIFGLSIFAYLVVMWCVISKGNLLDHVVWSWVIIYVVTFAVTGLCSWGTFAAGRVLVRQGVKALYLVIPLAVAVLAFGALVGSGTFHGQS